MAIRNAAKIPQPASMIDPAELSDGRPVTILQETTYSKRRGGDEPVDDEPSQEDIDRLMWKVHTFTSIGPRWCGDVPGKPDETYLNQRWGPGRYQIAPIDPKSGRTLPGQNEILLVDPDGEIVELEKQRRQGPVQYDGDPNGGYAPDPDASPQAHLQLERMRLEQQAASARERLEMAEFKRQETADREASARREREDREREDRRDEDRRRAARQDKLVDTLLAAALAAVPVVGQWLMRPAPAAPAMDPQLVAILAKATTQGPPQADALQQAIQMTTLVEGMVQRRIEATTPEEPERDDDLTKMLIPILAARFLGGGAPGEAPQGDTQAAMMQAASQALANPAAIKHLLATDRGGIVKAFAKVVIDDPALGTELYERLDAEAKAASKGSVQG